MWGRLRKHIIPIVLGVVALLPFVWTLNDPFVSDDWNFLWLADKRGFSVSEIVRTNTEGGEAGGSYRPLVSVFWRGLYQVAGTNPAPYRVATIGFHIANVLLLYFLLKKVLAERHYPPAIAGIAAFLFAITPSKAEIAWVSVVNDTLAVLFIVLSAWMYSAALNRPTWPRIVWLGGSLLLTFAALLTKEFAVIIPVIVAVLGWVFGQNFKTIVRHVVLFIAVVMAFFGLRYAAIHLLASDYTGTLTLSVYQIWRAYTSYTVAFFLSGWPRAWVTAEWMQHLWFGGFVLALAAAISMRALRHLRIIWLGAVTAILYVISVVPVVRFAIENSWDYVSDEGERFVYFPSIFLSLLVAVVGWAVYQTLNRPVFKKTFLVIGAVLMLGAYSTLWLKTWRWHQAAQLAGRLVDQGAAILTSNEYGGYVVVGLPEQWQGAQIFRNAYPFALALRLPGSDVPTKHLISSRLHTLYAANAPAFTLVKKSATEFTYHNPQLLISSPSGFVSSDYTLTNNGSVKQKYGISVPAVTTSTVLAFSPQFAQTNQSQPIAIVYFNGTAFVVENFNKDRNNNY